MITLTHLEYELAEQPDKILSRLKWSVEEVEKSWMDNFNYWKKSPETHKPWVGEIDKMNMKFSMEEPDSIFKRSLNVVLKGKIEPRASTTNVSIKLGIENFSFLLIFILYLGGIIFLTDAFTDEEFNSYLSLFFFLIFYPILGTCLIRRRIKRAERKLDHLFA
ncbi:MAG: hypothetical protein WBA74_04325 [Cyclobacteriaceae bacterium]